MTTKETKLRIEPALDEWLASQAAIAGIAKTKYIIQLLETQRLASQHTHPQLSPKLSPVSPTDETRLASIEARLAKLEVRDSTNEPTIPKTIPSDVPKFEKGQVITGQSAKTYSLLWASFEASQKLGKAEYHLSNKLGVLCKVIGTSRANKPKLKVVEAFPNDQLVYYPDGTFVRHHAEGVAEYYTKSELADKEALEATEEPTSDIESPCNEIAIEAIEMPSSPTIEDVIEQPLATQPSLTLTKKQFQTRYQLTPGEGYSVACQQGLAGGWSADDGYTWFYDSKAKQWSTEEPAVKQLELV